ncbi:MAG: hypothetical protein ACJAY4_000776 [Cryomorphaceae bacterium]
MEWTQIQCFCHAKIHTLLKSDLHFEKKRDLTAQISSGSRRWYRTHQKKK